MHAVKLHGIRIFAAIGFAQKGFSEPVLIRGEKMSLKIFAAIAIFSKLAKARLQSVLCILFADELQSTFPQVLSLLQRV